MFVRMQQSMSKQCSFFLTFLRNYLIQFRIAWCRSATLTTPNCMIRQKAVAGADFPFLVLTFSIALVHSIRGTWVETQVRDTVGGDQ